MRFVFRWAFRFFLVVVVLVVALLLLKDTLAKAALESRLRAASGLETRIGRLEIGLLAPTLTFENVRLYNPPEFGGSPLLHLPELHIEYDRAALAAGRLHLRLVRVHLAELNIVQDARGRKNLQAIEQQVRRKQSAKKVAVSLPVEFSGVDTLNLTLSKLRLVHLREPAKDREIDLGVRNEIITNVRSGKELSAAMLRLLLNRAGAQLLGLATAPAASPGGGGASASPPTSP